MKPFVSVVIPTYNRANLVTGAIDSVLNQTYENFELLVVDDHSTDDTEEIVKGYDDPRVSYLINKRAKGAQGARNTALYKAKGDWIAFLDSDDIWHPKKLECQHAAIQSNNTVCIAVGHSRKELSQLNYSNDCMNNQIIRYDIADLLYENPVGGFSCVMCKKETALEIKGLDENFTGMQDMDFYVRLRGYGEVIKIDSIHVKMNMDHPTRMSFNFEKKLKAAKLFHKKHSHLINKNILLKSRTQLRIFLFSVLSKKPSIVIRYLPWVLISLIVDFKNSVHFLKRIIKLYPHT